jgi:hypothetical protein
MDRASCGNSLGVPFPLGARRVGCVVSPPLQPSDFSMLDLCKHNGHNVYTGYQEPPNKGDNMLKQLTPLELEYEALIADIDGDHAAILEGYWQGRDGYEIAEQLNLDFKFVAVAIDAFRDLGY